MNRRVEDWSIERLHKARPRISFPEYQRQPNLWSLEKKRLLIDSILKDIDIPKLYFNNTEEGLEVVDGQQRLWAIWEYLDDDYQCKVDGELQYFSDLPDARRSAIGKYLLQVTMLQDAEDDYLRELFLRLQLGLLLVTGEKLNAATGAMKTFVFKKVANTTFVRELGIPNRRFAKETLGAQLCINSFSLAKAGTFSRTRYEDLLSFFKTYANPQGTDLQYFRTRCKTILTVLDELGACFGEDLGNLTNRSYIVSIYLLFEQLSENLSDKDKRLFVEFVETLWARLRQEVGAGIDRKNRELYSFETMISSAPGERYQIERRHAKLIEYFDYFRKFKKIKGDPA